MSIGPTLPVGGAGPIDPKQPVHRTQSKPPPPPIRDPIEVSGAGNLVNEALQIDPIRSARIQELRQAIRKGTLETPDRLEKALDRFLRMEWDTKA